MVLSARNGLPVAHTLSQATFHNRLVAYTTPSNVPFALQKPSAPSEHTMPCKVSCNVTSNASIVVHSPNIGVVPSIVLPHLQQLSLCQACKPPAYFSCTMCHAGFHPHCKSTQCQAAFHKQLRIQCAKQSFTGTTDHRLVFRPDATTTSDKSIMWLHANKTGWHLAGYSVSPGSAPVVAVAIHIGWAVYFLIITIGRSLQTLLCVPTLIAREPEAKLFVPGISTPSPEGRPIPH